MNKGKLVVRTAWHFRWADLAVTLGIAVAVAVLAGSLIVGDSVRGSLRRIITQRLGDIDDVMVSPHFFSAGLATKALHAEPLITTLGSCAPADETLTAPHVNIFGRADITNDTCTVSAPLARDLGVGVGDTLLVRLDARTGTPADAALRMQKDRLRVLRLRVRRVAPSDTLEGAFTFRGTQRPVRNVWVALVQLQKAMEQPGKANVLFVSREGKQAPDVQQLQAQIKQVATLEDYGLRIVPTPEGGSSLESDRLFLPDPVADAAARVAPKGVEVFAYLADTLADLRNGRTIPYSMVAGLSAPPGGPIGDSEIVLNQWAADDLLARPGDTITLSFPFRADTGLIETQIVKFAVVRVVPMTGLGADKTLVPRFKGLTDAETMGKWDPPRDFNFRPDRVRSVDEQYWEKYHAAPKAFVNLATAQGLWGTRHGHLTSIRFVENEQAFTQGLLARLDPGELGLRFRPIRAQMLAAASGNTDFSGLFIGFSFFLILSAGMLVTLLVRLAIEQRSRQIALLFATGFTESAVRRLVYAETALLLLVGCALGIAASVAYAWLMILGLRTVWNDALGTSLIGLHVRWLTLVISYVIGLFVGAFAVWRGVGRLKSLRAAELIAGRRPADSLPGRSRYRYLLAALLFGLLGAAFVFASAVLGAMGKAGAFFVAGFCLLVAALLVCRVWLTATGTAAADPGAFSAWVVARRNAGRNPTRSMLAIGLLASTTFLLAAVGSMKVGEHSFSYDKSSGTGGFTLVAELDTPILYDLNTAEGRDYLAVQARDPALWDRVTFVNMRVSSGDDISCRNLYKPDRPRIVSVPDRLIGLDAFAFSATLKDGDNPWRLLDDDDVGDNEIPVFADYDTAQWILKLPLGESLAITDDRGRPWKLQLMGMLDKSLFQGELLMGEASFLRVFPDVAGYRLILVKTQPDEIKPVKAILNRSLSDFGVSIDTTRERLAAFARIANSYISAFQLLGGLGLLLGSFGLTIVLIRAVLERRAELALLACVGFRARAIRDIVLNENAFLLVLGVLAGAVPAAVTVAPAFLQSLSSATPAATAERIFSGIAVLISIIIGVMLLLAFVAGRLTRRLGAADLRRE